MSTGNLSEYSMSSENPEDQAVLNNPNEKAESSDRDLPQPRPSNDSPPAPPHRSTGNCTIVRRNTARSIRPCLKSMMPVIQEQFERVVHGLREQTDMQLSLIEHMLKQLDAFKEILTHIKQKRAMQEDRKRNENRKLFYSGNTNTPLEKSRANLLKKDAPGNQSNPSISSSVLKLPSSNERLVHSDSLERSRTSNLHATSVAQFSSLFGSADSIVNEGGMAVPQIGITPSDEPAAPAAAPKGITKITGKLRSGLTKRLMARIYGSRPLKTLSRHLGLAEEEEEVDVEKGMGKRNVSRVSLDTQDGLLIPEHKWGLHPSSFFFTTWITFMSGIYLWIIFGVTTVASFEYSHFVSEFTPETQSVIITTIYLADTIINICTLRKNFAAMADYRVKTEVITFDWQQSVEMNMRGLFWMDAVTSIPWIFLFRGTFDRPSSLLIFYLLRLYRLPDCFEAPIWAHMLNNMIEFTGLGQSGLSVFSLGFGMILFLHFHACMVFLAGQWSNYEDPMWQGFIAQTTKTALDQYAWSLWAAMANTFPVTAIWTPLTTPERWCQGITIFFGALIYGTALALISSFSVDLDKSEKLYKEKMDEISEYMAYKKLPLDLRSRVRAYFQLKYRGSVFREDDILGELNPDLRRRLTASRSASMIKKVSFLNRSQEDGRDEVFVGEVSMALQEVFYISGDVVFEEGNQGSYMYFIVQGTVDIIVKGKVVGQLQSGAFFGELALLGNIPRTATIKATSACSMYRLYREHFMKIIDNFSDVKYRIQMIFEERMQKVEREKSIQ